MDSPEEIIQRSAMRRGRRAFLWVIALAILVGAVLFLNGLHFLGESLTGAGCEGCRVSDGRVMRAGARVAAIEQFANPVPGRPLALFLAPAAGAVVDSVRAGLLAARLEPIGHTGSWLIELVPLDSVRGLLMAARLVVAPNEKPLPVYGERLPPPP